MNYHRIRAAVSAARLWERVLSETDRQQLGANLQVAWRTLGTAGMWMQLRGVSVPRAVVDVAWELNLMGDRTRRWLLRELGEAPDDPEETLEKAIASGDVVLVEHPRAAYWRGQPISVDWGKRSALWDFLWLLCEHAKARKAVDLSTFNAADTAIVAKQKSRLRGLRGCPRSLAALIQPAGRYTQKLNLPPPQIRLFQMTLGETIRERSWMAKLCFAATACPTWRCCWHSTAALPLPHAATSSLSRRSLTSFSMLFMTRAAAC